MGNKILKWVGWIGFPLGIAAAIFALIFVFRWGSSVEIGNDDSADKINKENYKHVNLINEDDSTKALLDEFLSIDPTQEGITKAIGMTKQDGAFKIKLDKYMAEHQEDLTIRENNAKDYFCYLNTLKGQKRENFEEFFTNYPNNMSTLLAADGNLKFDPNKDKKDKNLVAEFKQNVKDYESMQTYLINVLTPAYTEYKKAQVEESDRYNALKTLQLAVDSVYGQNFVKVNQETGEKVKIESMKSLQKDFTVYTNMNHSLSISFILCYITFILAMGAVILFIFANIIKNFKTSYKGLLGLLALLAVALISYFFASPDINNEVFAKLSISPAEGRLIEAGCYTTYVVIIVAILSLFIAPIVSRFLSSKSNNSPKSIKK